MARKQRTDAEVEFKAKGLKALRGQWLDFAGDLAEPMILLAAGATKAQALWGGMQGIFLTRVLGPMGMVVGATTALLAVTSRLVSKWKEWGLVGAAAISRMTLEFRPLLGSMELARKRVKELYDFTAKTPFRMAEVVKANKILQTLTKGALASKGGMELVGDASAVANTRIDETARSVGRLYDGLMSGRPVGEASMRMQEMGLISGKTRNALEAMQKAGVSGAETWALVERELQKNKGAAQDLSQELEGLKSTQEDVQLQMEAGFGKGFLEGEKATIKATTAAMEKMAPVAEYLGEQIGTVSNWLDRGKAKMMDMLTSIPGLSGGVMFLANAFAVLTGGIILATGAALAKFLLGVMAVTTASKRQIAVMAADTAVKGVNVGVTRNLTIAQAQLAGAYTAVRGGAVLTALGHLKVAAAQTVVAFRTNALAASTGVLSGVFKGLVVVLRFVVVQLRAMAVAIISNPFMLAAAAVLALGAAMLHFRNSAEKAAKALRDYRKASDDVVDGLEAQRKGLETVTDLRKHEADVIRRLGEAYQEEAKHRREGNDEMLYYAQRKVNALRDEMEATKAVRIESLRMSDAQKKQEERDYREGKDVRDSKRDAELEDSSADGRVSILQRRADEARRKQEAARADMAAEDATKQKAGSLPLVDVEKKIGLEQEVKEIEESLAGLREKRDSGFYKVGIGKDHTEGSIKKRERELAAKREELSLINARGGAGAQTEAGLESDSEISRLAAKLSLYKQIAKASEDLASARKVEADLGKDAGESEKSNAANAVEKAKAEMYALKSLRGEFGGFGSEREVQDAETKLGRLRENRSDEASGKKVYEADRALEKAKKDRENEIARTRIDAESAVAALRFKGMEAEEKSIGFAREKLKMALESKRIGDAEYESQMKVLRAREDGMRERAREREQRLASSLQESSLRRKSEEARRSGDQERSKALRKEADNVRDARRKRELEKEAGELTSDPAKIKKYVDAVMAEEKTARANQRKQDEDDSEAKRQRTRVGGVGLLEAEALRAGGKTKEAGQVEEKRNRELDEIRRGELQKKYREDGFGAEEADGLANRDIKVGQAQRGIDLLRSQAGGSNVVASSLAAIGGGGRAVGTDPNTRVLEQIREYLKDIRDAEKDDVLSVN